MMVWALRRPVLEPEPLDRIRERVERENRKTAAKKRR